MALAIITEQETILRRVLNFVETATGLGAGKVIWAELSVEKRDLPMATIQITSDGQKFGQDEVLDEIVAGPSLTRRTRGWRRMTVTINAYTVPRSDLTQKDAVDILRDMKSYLNVPSVLEANREACISIIDESPVTDISTVVGDRWERRATTDLFVYYAAETEEGGLTDAWIDTIEPITVAEGTLTLTE